MSEASWDWDEQLEEVAGGLTRNDRVSSYLVILLTIAALALGLLLHQRLISQTWTYVSREAGIEAAYPAGWIVDEGGTAVATISDPRARPFKTQYQISAIPAAGQTSIRNVRDGLTIQRSTDLAAYRVLDVTDVEMSGAQLRQMDFAFVQADPNPFIQRLPTVVLGRDIFIRDADRVIVVTYMAAEQSFDAGLPDFDRFVASLQY